MKEDMIYQATHQEAPPMTGVGSKEQTRPSDLWSSAPVCLHCSMVISTVLGVRIFPRRFSVWNGAQRTQGHDPHGGGLDLDLDPDSARGVFIVSKLPKDQSPL